MGRTVAERPHAAAADAAAPSSRVSASARRAKRRAAKAAAATQPLTPAEVQRRAQQAAVRELALKVRAQGQTFNKWKAKRAVETRRKAGKPVGSRSAADRGGAGAAAPTPPLTGAAAAAPAATAPSAPRNDTVLVLPIFWNKRPAEKAAVLAAAEAAARALRSAGLTVTVDNDDAASPGQKMGRADAAGVSVRVEVGPKDLAPGTASVAVAAAEGGVAPRTPVPDRGRRMVAAVRRALGLSETGDGGEDDDEEEEAEEDPSSPASPPPTTTAAPAAAPVTGEGLDDDFGDLGGVESDGGGRKKKKKQW